MQTSRRFSRPPPSAGELVDFQINGPRRPRLDARRASVQDAPEARRAARHREIGLGIFEDDGRPAALPRGDLPLQPQPQHRRIKRAAVEKHGIDARTPAQEFREVTRHRAVRRRTGSAHSAQRGLLARGLRVGVAFGEKAVHENRVDLRRARCAR